jgi:DNA-binding transcriptional ArsR family regulator
MQDEQIDFVFKALAHPERRRILALLHRRPGQSLFEICASAVTADGEPLSRQTISQHLEMLERAGLVEISWEGRTKLHSLNLGPLRAALKLSVNHYL